jgi:hypothetical protein
VVFLIEENDRTPADLYRLRQLCPDMVSERTFIGNNPKHRMWIVTCDNHPALEEGEGHGP